MDTCFIWGTPAVVRISGDRYDVNSARAGGCYAFTGTAMAIWNNTGQSQKESLRSKLTTWIVDQHRAGIENPLINSAILELVQQRRRLRHSERVLRFFLMLIDQQFKVSDHIRIAGIVDQNTEAMLNRISAWIEAESEKDVSPFLSLLQDAGYLVHHNNKWRLTAAGFERLEQAEGGGANTNQVFVAMWFNEAMDPIYTDGIAPAIEEVGFRAFRIDRKEHNNKIDDEIIAEIRRSRFMIADFTCDVFDIKGKKKAEARGGVYYEAGFAQGLSMPVIWTVRSDCIDHVHFDTRQFAHIVWHDAGDLKQKLINRIRASITP